MGNWVVYFTGPRRSASSRCPAGSARPRPGPGPHLLLRHLRRHRAHRSTGAATPAQTRTGTTPPGCSSPAQDDPVPYPLAGWGYAEVGRGRRGRRPETTADRRRPGRRPGLGHLGPPRPRRCLPADAVRGHRCPPGWTRSPASSPASAPSRSTPSSPPTCTSATGVGVFGQGVIGLLATRLAMLSGATGDRRRRHRRPAGAGPRLRRATRSSTPSADVRRRRLAGSPAAGAPTCAIELSGAYPALHEAIRSVAADGRVVAAGFYQGAGRRARASARSSTTTGSSWSASQIAGPIPRASMPAAGTGDRLQQTFMDLVADGQRRPRPPLVSHVVAVADAADALRAARRAAPPTPSRSCWTSG